MLAPADLTVSGRFIIPVAVYLLKPAGTLNTGGSREHGPSVSPLNSPLHEHAHVDLADFSKRLPQRRQA
jgi:hypothetical protein